MCIGVRRLGLNRPRTCLMAPMVSPARRAFTIKRFARVVPRVAPMALPLCTLFIRTTLGLLCREVPRVPLNPRARTFILCRPISDCPSARINLIGLLTATTRPGTLSPTQLTTVVTAADPLEFAGFAIRTRFPRQR